MASKSVGVYLLSIIAGIVFFRVGAIGVNYGLYLSGQGKQSFASAFQFLPLLELMASMVFLFSCLIMQRRFQIKLPRDELVTKGALGALVFFVSTFLHPYLIGREHSFLKGFAAAINQRDVVRLQEWAVATIKAREKGEIPPSEVPSFVHQVWKRPPQTIMVDTHGEQAKCVDLRYGGGFHHWGILMGDEGLKVESFRGFHAILIGPGLYVYSDN